MTYNVFSGTLNHTQSINSVREHIPGTTRAIFTKFLCMLPMAVARSSSESKHRFNFKSQGEGAILGVFLPTDNAS